MPNPRQYSSNAARQAEYRRRKADVRGAVASNHDAPAISRATLAKRQRDIVKALDALLEAREQYQGERSDDWLDSNARDEFDAQTEDIENARNTLQDC